MNLSLLIARRYFRSKKKKNFIQVISNISMVGVAIGTMALVVVLSVFNGLEDLIRESYNTFDPEIKIVPKRGKTFDVNDSLLNVIQQVEGVSIVTEVIEDKALLGYQDATMTAILKGVSDNFIEQNRLNKAMVHGELALKKDGKSFAILGRGVQYTLSVSPSNEFYALQVFSPKRETEAGFNPDPMTRYFKRRNIMPGGVFAIEKQFDANYVLVPLDFAANLFDYAGKRTALEIKTMEDIKISQVQESLQEILGNHLEVLNSDQQHESLLKAIKIEKLFVYLTFSFILAVASFNIFFSLSMLAIDKKKDVAMLIAMGARKKVVRSVFLYEGAIIAFIGTVSGLAVGLLVCWAQQTFGLVSMGMQTAIVDAYPVKMQFTDFFYTAVSITIITFLASYRPASIAARTEVKDFL
ncbi:lipoprotein-releasing system permease protein [Catalinimonas alkaloidigena]|uniref:ABC transporter permease n=1 Tax=Catalinimonas alkaloidigena TaxID=1075417 RepID=UPI0024066B62|nr:FtsX-like permease family protein [Catalinimonas alkaloidigena]MDF9800900.1 lipoprotein-releasing system permease protein [Catalinimonas alkaloidigena]